MLFRSIQFRLLNRSKGAAVQGPRSQIDRRLYREAMQAELARTPNLTLMAGTAEGLIMDGDRVVGVVTLGQGGGCGEQIRAAAVVLTTGTFLNGVIHRGDERIPAGRHGEDPSTGMAAVTVGRTTPRRRSASVLMPRPPATSTRPS